MVLILWLKKLEKGKESYYTKKPLKRTRRIVQHGAWGKKAPRVLSRRESMALVIYTETPLDRGRGEPSLAAGAALKPRRSERARSWCPREAASSLQVRLDTHKPVAQM